MIKGTQEFFGSTTVGERGQVVIPAEARKAMKLKNGDKLLAFGMGHDMLVLTKVSQLEKFTQQLASKLETFQTAINSAKPYKRAGGKK